MPHPPSGPADAPAAAVGAVVLAAGGSRRMGRPKQLLALGGAFGGEPLVRRAARAALAAGAAPVVVVLGAGAAEVARALDGLDVHVVTHAGWAAGLASSLAAGVRALEGRTAAAPCDGVLLTLADQPLVDAAALGALLAAFDAERRVVAAAYAGTVGVPAVVGREHLDDLLASLAGDAGAGRWLRVRSAWVTAVPLPQAAVDLDAPEDFARLQQLATALGASSGPG